MYLYMPEEKPGLFSGLLSSYKYVVYWYLQASKGWLND